MIVRVWSNLALLSVIAACGGDPPAPPPPLPPPPSIDAGVPWTTVHADPFTVQMPHAATLKPPTELMVRDGAIRYALDVRPLPAYLIAQSDNTIIESFSKPARAHGTVWHSHHFNVDGHRAFEQDIDADGERTYVVYLPFGRWHAQLTARYPADKVDDRAAHRLIASLHVAPVSPTTTAWECDSLLASLCEACGSGSPACANKLSEGATADACAVESVMLFPEKLRQDECAHTKKLGQVDLRGLAKVKFDPTQVKVTEDGITVEGTMTTGIHGG